MIGDTAACQHSKRRYSEIAAHGAFLCESANSFQDFMILAGVKSQKVI